LPLVTASLSNNEGRHSPANGGHVWTGGWLEEDWVAKRRFAWAYCLPGSALPAGRRPWRSLEAAC